MKAILISIHPKWVEKILNGEKTIEVRKKFPKDYKGWVYIYCTKKEYLVLENEKDTECENYYVEQFVTVNKTRYTEKQIKLMYGKSYDGKVVARFYCDKVEEIKYHFGYYDMGEWTENYILEKSCLSAEELDNYLQASKDYDEKKPSRVYGYAIHISNLEIFDKPKELNEFYSCFTCKRYERIFGNNNIEVDKKYGGLRQPVKGGYEYIYPLIKAPQSFMYVEVEE